MKKLLLLILAISLAITLYAQGKHTFTYNSKEFLLDNKPFRIISGEIHPARIPEAYWRHRIQMAKAMGCNTIAAYLFWNYYESSPGKFDFTSEGHDIVKFIRIAQEEGMWVLLRPGPYVCAEWDFGGLPPYLLKIPDIKVRCMDKRYIEAVTRYIDTLSAIIKSMLCTSGGPILMVQIENEYGSYGNDRKYMSTLKDLWKNNGIDVPFFTADGPTPYMLEAGNPEGCIIGLDSGSSPEDFAQARKRNPNVPAFSSETYPGWLTHWGEEWAKVDTIDLLKEVRFLLDSNISFNFYVIHGGTNFGFTAGANSGGKGYEPDVTSYDYDAPINEQGRPTAKYFALRRLISKYVSNIPPVPEALPVMDLPVLMPQVFATVWGHLPQAYISPQPKTMETMDQHSGFILYKTILVGHKSGKLTITDLHDYALVFLDGKFIGKLDRREGENTINLPASQEKNPVLEIFVEGMGRINYGQYIIDRKGITDRVTLNGMTLMSWEITKIPFDEEYIANLETGYIDPERRGYFFKSVFLLENVADTYIDMSNYQKGIVFVNGHNLGRYWNIGPQQRLYCPATFLKKGMNEILIFDLLETEPKSISGKKTLE